MMLGMPSHAPLAEIASPAARLAPLIVSITLLGGVSTALSACDWDPVTPPMPMVYAPLLCEMYRRDPSGLRATPSMFGLVAKEIVVGWVIAAVSTTPTD